MPWHRDDFGYTLAELLVVMALMVIVLTTAYTVFEVTANGSKASDRESFIAREIGAPLGTAERLLMQNYTIKTGYVASLGRTVTPSRYLIAFATDQDNDGKEEVHVIEATADGRLIMTRREDVDSPAPKTFDWSENNKNQADGVPLFTYYDYNGVEITDAGAFASARTVTVRIATEFDGKQFSDSRDVLFRNR